MAADGREGRLGGRHCCPSFGDEERRRSGCFVVVRGCPLRTVEDSCEWHAGGTVGEDEAAPTWRPRLPARPEGGARPW